MTHFPQWLEARTTGLSAHRGAVAFAPENTLEAFQEAIAHGYGAVEMDVQMSTDGELFLLHDSTLNRTTNGTGVAADLTWGDLSKLTIDTTGYPKYKNLKIPTFDSVIKVLGPTELILNIDGSKGDWNNKTFTDKIVNTLKKYGAYERSFFVLSNQAIRDKFVSLYPDATVAWLFSGDIAKEIAEVKKYKSALISIANKDATLDRLKQFEDSGVRYQVHLVDKDTDLYKYWNSTRMVRLIETGTLIPENIVNTQYNMLPDSDVSSLDKTFGPFPRYFSDAGVASITDLKFVKINDAPTPSGWVVQATGDGKGSANAARGLCWYQGGTIHLEIGNVYTMSCYARVISGRAKIRLQYGVSPYVRTFQEVTSDEFEQYSWTFTAEQGDTLIYMPAGSGDLVGTVQMCGFKLEPGDKATPWTLAQGEGF